jgi:HPt (histidine-containing phosphotransfer) domain-containing protein
MLLPELRTGHPFVQLLRLRYRVSRESRLRRIPVFKFTLEGTFVEPWDPVRALDGVGGDVQFLNELAGIFCAACPTLLTSLRESIAARAKYNAADTAHLLGSAARGLAAQRVADAAFAIEAMVRRNEFEGIEDHYQALSQDAGRLVEVLNKFRSEQFGLDERSSRR